MNKSFVVLALASLGVSCWADTFQILGTFSYGGESWGTAISADGTTVVGYSTSDKGTRAFKWRAETGLVDIGSATGLDESMAWGVSRDGMKVALGGTSIYTLDPFSGYQLVPISPEQRVTVQAMSADGKCLVGWFRDLGNVRAFRWTPIGGFEVLATDPLVVDFQAFATSADGSTTVGYENYHHGSDITSIACCWTHRGIRLLGTVHANDRSFATAVSADGTRIAGYMYQGGLQYACLWQLGANVLPLATFPQPSYSKSTGISPDGEVVIGQSVTFAGSTGFLWRKDHGLLDLKSFLLGRGLSAQLSGYTLKNLTGVTQVAGVASVTGAAVKDGNRVAFLARINLDETRQPRSAQPK